MAGDAVSAGEIEWATVVPGNRRGFELEAGANRLRGEALEEQPQLADGGGLENRPLHLLDRADDHLLPIQSLLTS